VTGEVDRPALAAGLEGSTGVVSLLALDERPHARLRSVPTGFVQTLTLVQTLGEAAVPAPLWCVTRGAVATGRDDRLNVRQSLIWGLGRVVGLEHPDRWGGLVDLNGAVDERLASVLAGDEDQVAIRDSAVLVRRLVRAQPARAAAAWQTSGTAVITGGTGALGAQVARWLPGLGAEHLLLLSRSGLDAPGARELEAELLERGVAVTVAACDVGDRQALAQVISSVPPTRPVRTVVHAAASLDDGTVDSLTPDQLDRVLRVKAEGAWHLHEVTSGMELDAFVLFSSLGGTVGLPGQGNYAPGNAFLDALAQYRRSAGLPATSVAWGAWAGGGMARGTVAGVLRRHGLIEMAPQRALAALRQVLSMEEAAPVLAGIDWNRFYTAFTALRPSPMLQEIPDIARFLDTTGETPLLRRLSAASGAVRERLLIDLVCSHVAAVLGYDSQAAVQPDRAFQLIGFDSVTGVELRNRVSAATGLSLPTTTVFDFPTPAALAGYLGDRLTVAGSAQAAGEPHRPSEPSIDPSTASDEELFDLIDRDLGVS